MNKKKEKRHVKEACLPRVCTCVLGEQAHFFIIITKYGH